MPSRGDIFKNGYIFHIFNKTLDHKVIFAEKNLAILFLELLEYYRSSKSNLRYSHFKELSDDVKVHKEKELLLEKYFKIDILAFCLMPNHFHLILRQRIEDGIVRFMSDVLNSLTRFYNVKSGRKGPIFLPQFRSRHITTREQLIHTSRYQHLNPYSSGILASVEDLITYPLSSFNEYLGLNITNLCQTNVVLTEFKNDKNLYKIFVLSNAKHQKMLESVKHVEKWL